MITTIGLSIVMGTALALTPLGYAIFTNSVTHPSQAKLLAASVFVVVCVSITFGVGTMNTMAGIRLNDHTNLYMATRTAELVNAAPGIEHFERPDYLRELDLLNEDRAVVGNGPRIAVNLAQISIMVILSIILLGSIEPFFVVLPLFGLAPFFSTRKSVQIRQQTEERLAEDRRLANQLFELTAAASSGRELRVYGLAPELQARHAALTAHIVREVRRAAAKGTGIAVGGWTIFGAAFTVVIASAVLPRRTGMRVRVRWSWPSRWATRSDARWSRWPTVWVSCSRRSRRLTGSCGWKIPPRTQHRSSPTPPRRRLD